VSKSEQPLQRGDIWMVDFGIDPQHWPDPSDSQARHSIDPHDPEQAFFRPALIVSENRLHHPQLRLVIVVPGTSTLRDLPLHVVAQPDSENGLSATTAFQVEQIRSISVSRLIGRAGRLDSVLCHAVDETLRTVLALDPGW
jgi:mRNA interferase MazF